MEENSRGRKSKVGGRKDKIRLNQMKGKKTVGKKGSVLRRE